jgi:hypothetical protein
LKQNDRIDLLKTPALANRDERDAFLKRFEATFPQKTSHSHDFVLKDINFDIPSQCVILIIETHAKKVLEPLDHADCMG